MHPFFVSILWGIIVSLALDNRFSLSWIIVLALLDNRFVA